MSACAVEVNDVSYVFIFGGWVDKRVKNISRIEVYNENDDK